MKFGTDIHGAQRMNSSDFGDPLTFPVAPSAGQSFTLICEISQHPLDSLSSYLVDIHGI